jgi:hypothetical protein
MKTPDSDSFLDLLSLLSGHQNILYNHEEISVEFESLKQLLIKKGRLNQELLCELENNNVYQWLYKQDSTLEMSRDGTVHGFVNASKEAIGTPSLNRWSEEWADKMSRWILEYAIGSVDKYNHETNPEALRQECFDGLVVKIAFQEIDPWLTHFLWSFLPLLFPHKSIQELISVDKIKDERHEKTLNSIDTVLANLGDDEYTVKMLNSKGNQEITTDCIKNLLLMKESILIKQALNHSVSPKYYGKANSSAEVRLFLSKIWNWLNDAGLGSKPKVLNNLLAMPIIQSENKLISSRAVETLIRKLKAGASERDRGVPVRRNWADGPFGFAVDSEFQLRMMDTSLYRS